MLEYFRQQHQLHFTPAGIWEMDTTTNKKTAIDAARYDNLSWDKSKYKNDNMGRIKLPNGIVVLDIDKAKTTIDGNSITIPAYDVTIPIGLYTQTTKQGSYHIYYSITPEQQADIGTKTLIKMNGVDIDLIQNYVIFEWHSFSQFNELHKGEILPLPDSIRLIAEEHMDDKEMEPAKHEHLALSSNINRFNLLTAYMDNKLKKNTERNAFFRSILPKEYHTVDGKRVNKFGWDKLSLSYDLINKIAVKLTTTKELDFNMHVIPALYCILEEFKIDPLSKKSQHILFKQILPSLPQHQSIEDFKIDDDNRTFQELINDQPDTVYPVFRTIHMGKLRFIHIDKHSLRPVPQNNDYLFDLTAAKALHPERTFFDEAERKKLWDDNLPLVEIITDPFEPSYQIDDYSRHQVNLSQPTSYISSVDARQTTPERNLLLRLLHSVVHPDYLELVIRYYGEVFFSKTPPVTILWIATRDSEMGGTGKSMVTITIPGAILKQQATTISDKVLNSGYDVTGDIRMLSVEEGATTGKEHSLTYQTLKQLTSPTYTKSNTKYGALAAKRNKVCVTGSSNQLPKLDQSDRRYICLEPAHIAGHTDRLSLADSLELAQFEQGLGYGFEETIQDFTNHIYYHYLEPMTQEVKEGIYSKAPRTIYTHDWIVGGLTNVKTILMNIGSPEELMGSIHEDRQDGIELLLKHLILMFNPDVNKVALSWKWFSELIPMIASDADIDLTKASVSRMLGNVKFTAASPWFLNKAKEINSQYPQSFYTIPITNDAIQQYVVILGTLINKPQPNLEDIDE